MDDGLKILENKEKLKASYEKNAENVNRKIDDELKNKLVISLYGSVNAGKSSAINALLGKKISEVSPIPGWTKDVQLYPYGKDVLIADTPGIADIDEDTAAKATDFVQKDADLVLFFVSSDSGVTGPILNSFKAIVTQNKELLGVLTKIDIKDCEEVDVVLKHTTDQFNACRKRTKVIPISSKKHINIDTLQKEILSVLDDKGKDLLWAKLNKDKWPAVHHYILSSCGAIAGMGLLNNEINLDKVTEIQLEMVKKIACVYSVSVTPTDLLHFVTDLCSRDLSFKLFVEAHKLIAPYIKRIPFIEKGINIALPAAVTYGIGCAANAYYSSGMKKTADELDKVFREKVMEYSTKDVEELKKWIKGKAVSFLGMNN